MPSRVVLLQRATHDASCFVPSGTVVLRRRRRGAPPVTAPAKHAYGARRYNARSAPLAAARVSMVAEGYDSTKVSDAKFVAEGAPSSRPPSANSSTPISDEQRALLSGRDGGGGDGGDGGAHMLTTGGVDVRVAIAGGALVFITGAILVAMGTGVLSGDSFIVLASWFEARGQSAVLLYALLYFVLELVAVPALPLTLGSGYLFGITTGTAAVSVASTAAATAAFLISRYGLRDYISSVATKYPRFRAMDRAIGREGFKFVLLLRLSPLLPFSISNYLYGLTSVKLVEYTLGSWLGMLPGTIAYVSAGAAIDALTDLTEKGNSVNPVLVGIGVVATIAVLFFVGRLAASAVEAEGDFTESV